MKKLSNADMPAMPCFNESGSPIHHSSAGIHDGCLIGLTKREHFAAMAMQGILAGNSLIDLRNIAAENGMDDIGHVVRVMAFNAADIMLSEGEE